MDASQIDVRGNRAGFEDLEEVFRERREHKLVANAVEHVLSDRPFLPLAIVISLHANEIIHHMLPGSLFHLRVGAFQVCDALLAVQQWLAIGFVAGLQEFLCDIRVFGFERELLPREIVKGVIHAPRSAKQAVAIVHKLSCYRGAIPNRYRRLSV